MYILFISPFSKKEEKMLVEMKQWFQELARIWYKEPHALNVERQGLK